jgi:hypothetical protein
MTFEKVMISLIFLPIKLLSRAVFYWGDNGINPSNVSFNGAPKVTVTANDDSEGNFLMKYFVNVGFYWAPERSVYLMKYNSSGNEVWDSPAVVSDAFGRSPSGDKD